jgi:type II secretion system protein H
MIKTRPAGFTLVELILVMAVLAIVMAFVAPTLSRSLRGRALEQEAIRFIAVTEFARDEAISMGSPMNIWIDTTSRRFGVLPADVYAGIDLRKEYALGSDVEFDALEGALQSDGVAITFRPDGTPSVESITGVRLTDRYDETVSVNRVSNGLGYEIVTGGN